MKSKTVSSSLTSSNDVRYTVTMSHYILETCNYFSAKILHRFSEGEADTLEVITRDRTITVGLVAADGRRSADACAALCMHSTLKHKVRCSPPDQSSPGMRSESKPSVTKFQYGHPVTAKFVCHNPSNL